MRLVADVGGTNTRVAFCDDGQLRAQSVRSFANAQYDSFDEVLADFLAQGAPDMTDMVVAVAGPVHGATARLTNRDWTLETASLQAAFGAARVHLLNDLTALGYSVPHLGASHLRLIRAGSGAPAGLRQSLVAGIGTGFNVSPVIEGAGGVLCPAAEGGHVSLPWAVAIALEQSGVSPSLFPTVEALFSGRGFVQFCEVKTARAPLDGQTIIAAYGSEGNAPLSRAVEAYAALIGWLLRDLTLAYMALSGLYLAGSVARAVARCAPDALADVLHLPCAIRKDTVPPLWSIEEDSAALLGCAGFARF